MAIPSIEELKIIADELEQELESCEKDLKKTSILLVKIQSFQTMLNKREEDGEIRILRVKAQSFLKKVQQLCQKRNKEKSDLEQEMNDARIRVKKINEACDPDMELKERDFFSKQNEHLDNYILNAIDSIDSLKRQGVYIDRINENLRSGLIRMGVSSAFLNRIESRFKRDKLIFIILFFIIILFILFLRFFF